MMIFDFGDADAGRIISALLNELNGIETKNYLLEDENKRLKEELAGYKSKESEAENNG